ncbi:MAG: hypothetical protein ACKVII_01885 [Planctomycetales bacterium]|jgi:hypothetical protein
MALRNFDSRVALCMTAFTRRVLLVGFVGIGLAVAGCGGGGDASSETTQTTSDSSTSAAPADMAMNDATMNDSAMMGAGTEMNGPSTQDAMMAEMNGAGGSGEEFGDTGIGDTALGHAEEGGGASDPTTSDALMAAQMEARAGETATASDPSLVDATAQAQMAAAAAGAGTDPASDPSLGDSTQAAQMAAVAGGANGEFGAGTESGGFGPDSNGAGSNGGGAAKEPPADSPDYPAFKIVMGLMQGKHDGLKEFVSTRSRGLTEKIRSGSLTKTEIDDLKKTFAQPQLVGTPRTIRGSRTVTLNSAGQVISLVSKKQGSDWKVSSISIRAAKKR